MVATSASGTWRRGPLRTYPCLRSERAPAAVALHRSGPSAPLYDMHLELEFGVVLAGAMERTYDGFGRELGPGDIWYCGAWEPHGSRATRPGTERLYFTALPTWLSTLRFPEAPWFSPILPFTVRPERRPRPDAATRARLLALGRALADAPPDTTGHDLRARLDLLQLLLLAQTGWHGDQAGSPAQDYGRLAPAVALAQQARGAIGEDRAAAACDLPRARFAARFAALFETSFTQYAMRCRLAGAAAQLLAGDDPLKKTARDWGFTDASHFHRSFQKRYGATPGAYRAAEAAR